jgi:hypothetical protein
MYLWVVKVLHSEKKSEFYQREDAEDIRNRWKASVRLARYPLIFILLWIFPIINRIENLIAGDDGVFFLVLMHTICISLQGTINSLAYFLGEDIIYLCTPKGVTSAAHNFFSKEKRSSQVQRYQLKTSLDDLKIPESVDVDAEQVQLENMEEVQLE